MILLVTLLLFLALTVSFDNIALESPGLGAKFLLLGLAFSVTVSEGVFRSLRIRLPARYRLPYYFILTLLFAYPYALAELSVRGHDAKMAWGVLLFPLAASGVFLTLWPAVRTRGADEPPSGTPWRWPWFPWPLFVFLLVAVCLRSYSLTMAFEPYKGSAVGFQPYFLTPLVLVAAILILEAGITNHSRGAQVVGLLLPALAIGMSVSGDQFNPVALRYVTLLIDAVASPLRLALVASGAFYAVLWRRGFGLGEIGLVACLALASVVGPNTTTFDHLDPPQALPLALIALVELLPGLWKQSLLRTTVGLAAAALAITTSGWTPNLGEHSRFVLLHATGVLVLALAALYDDRWSRLLRRLALPVIPAAALVAATSYEFVYPEVPRAGHALYVVALCLIVIVYWRRSPATGQLLAAMLTLAALLTLGLRGSYLALKSSPLEKGLPWLAAGLGLLLLATLLSFTKGGLIIRGWRALRLLNLDEAAVGVK